ncbi:MAG: exodeoxyribonuclease VII large subunit [Lachnospiraceae bacterium]
MKRQNSYSVSQINSYIKNMFAQDFMLRNICIKGEVSNCKYHSSGHIYFTLKDEQGAIDAIMFAGNRKGLNFAMKDGDKVTACGSVEVYIRDGKYQLYAREIEKDGEGDLYHRFLELKLELEEMGMFAQEYKKPIPKYIRTLGIVTAATGAAIWDIKNIAHRRNPYVQLILYPAIVQGAEAPLSIAKGIRSLDEYGVDLIIASRGGGSIEDLWAFNEEIVARAIFECETPVISAVGHETDTTISDFVADLRAPTPSAAAELAVFDVKEYDQQLYRFQTLLRGAVTDKLRNYHHKTDLFQSRLKTVSPGNRLNSLRQTCIHLDDMLSNQIRDKLQRSRYRLAALSVKMDGLSPMKQLSKGLAFVTDENDVRIYSVDQIRKDDTMKVRLSDGIVTTQVIEKDKIENEG